MAFGTLILMLVARGDACWVSCGRVAPPAAALLLYCWYRWEARGDRQMLQCAQVLSCGCRKACAVSFGAFQGSCWALGGFRNPPSGNSRILVVQRAAPAGLCVALCNYKCISCIRLGQYGTCSIVRGGMSGSDNSSRVSRRKAGLTSSLDIQGAIENHS